MASPNIVILSPDTFPKEVLHSEVPVLVDFWAEWCGPCKMLTPILDELAEEYSGRVKVAKVNIDDHQALAAEYNVRAVPTLLLFQGGEVVRQIVGMSGASRRDLKATFDKLVAA